MPPHEFAQLVDGARRSGLHDLVREVPEAMKPRQIKVTSGAPQTIESGAPVPASTLQTLRRSALGCLATASTCAR